VSRLHYAACGCVCYRQVGDLDLATYECAVTPSKVIPIRCSAFNALAFGVAIGIRRTSTNREVFAACGLDAALRGEFQHSAHFGDLGRGPPNAPVITGAVNLDRGGVILEKSRRGGGFTFVDQVLNPYAVAIGHRSGGATLLTWPANEKASPMADRALFCR